MVCFSQRGAIHHSWSRTFKLEICSRSDNSLTSAISSMQFLISQIFCAVPRQNNNVFLCIFSLSLDCVMITHLFFIQCGLLIAMRLYTSLKFQGQRQKCVFIILLLFEETKLHTNFTTFFLFSFSRNNFQSPQAHIGSMFKEFCWLIWNTIASDRFGVRDSWSDVGRKYGSVAGIHVQGRSACVTESSGKFFESCRKLAGLLLFRYFHYLIKTKTFVLDKQVKGLTTEHGRCTTNSTFPHENAPVELPPRRQRNSFANLDPITKSGIKRETDLIMQSAVQTFPHSYLHPQPYMPSPYEPARKRHMKNLYTTLDQQETRGSVLRDGSKAASTGSPSPIGKSGYRPASSGSSVAPTEADTMQTERDSPQQSK